jgi:hypothetical protein
MARADGGLGGGGDEGSPIASWTTVGGLQPEGVAAGWVVFGEAPGQHGGRTVGEQLWLR